MMGWDGWGGLGAMSLFSLLFMAGFWVLVVAGVVLVVRALTGPRHDPGPSHQGLARVSATPPSAAGDSAPSGALRILEERYARGEIERDEFLQRKADLLG